MVRKLDCQVESAISFLKAEFQFPLDGHKTPLKALCWFAASKMVEEMNDLSTRELTELVQFGFEGFRTKAHIAEFLRGYDGDMDAFAAEITEFFGGDACTMPE